MTAIATNTEQNTVVSTVENHTQHRNQILRITALGLFAALWLLPPFLISGFIWRYAVDVPLWDDYVTGETFYEAIPHGFTWEQLIAQHNESRPLFPRLLFQVLDRLSHWDVRYQMGASFVVIFCTGLLLIVICWKTIDSPLLALTTAVMVNFMLFSPVQWANLLWGIQFIVFVPAFALLIIMLATGSSLNLWISMFIAAIAAVVSTYSNSNGLLVWFLAVPFFLVHPSKRRFWALGLWMVLAAGFIGYYFHGYVKRPDHPALSLAFHDPKLAGQFLLAFMGNGVRQTWDFPTAVTLGSGIGSVWALGVLAVAVMGRKGELWRKSLPWIMLGGYTITSGVIATLGRFGFGPGAAIADRYPTFAIPLWYSIVPLWCVVLRHCIPGKALRETMSTTVIAGGWAAVAFFMIKGLMFIPFEVLRYNARMLAGRTAAQFSMVAPDDEVIKTILYPDPPSAEKTIAELDHLDLFHPQCFRTNDISPIAVKDWGTKGGNFDTLMLDGDHLLLTGWAYIPPHGALVDAVLLTAPDAAGTERVFAIVSDDRGDRPDVAKALKHVSLEQAGWSKTIDRNRLPRGTVVSAWAYDSYSRRAYRLAGTQQVP